VEKIDRNELFALLGRSTAGAPLPHLPTPEELPEADWDTTTEVLCPADVFDTNSLPAAAPLALSVGSPVAVQPCAPPLEVPQKAVVKTTIRGVSARADQAKLQRLLEKSVPRLWKYAVENTHSTDSAVQRQKLRELLVWLFEKEGYRVTQNAAAPYRLNNKEIKGRIELVIRRETGPDLLALETDWVKTPASVLKLQNWSRHNVAVGWIVGAPCEPAALLGWRRFADEVSASRSIRWLSILHLAHGWIDD
jgi:hypothetical protein